MSGDLSKNAMPKEELQSNVAPLLATSTLENRKEACKTYIEQIKLLVTLASAFVVAPVALISLLNTKDRIKVPPEIIDKLILSEGLLIASIFFGYMALASVTGEQDSGTFNVYRPATRIYSLLQVFAYLAGAAVFVYLARMQLL